MSLMGRLTAFVSNTTMALVEDGALPWSRRFDMGNSGLTGNLGDGSMADEKSEALLQSLDRVVTVTDRPGATPGDKTVPMFPAEYEATRYAIVRDKIKLGVLEPLMQDPYLEDVSTSGLGPIYLEHKIFGPMACNIDSLVKTRFEEVPAI